MKILFIFVRKFSLYLWENFFYIYENIFIFVGNFFFYICGKFVLYLWEIFFYICGKIFFTFVRFDLDRFGKKTLFKNVLCALYISFCPYGSFLWLKKC